MSTELVGSFSTMQCTSHRNYLLITDIDECQFSDCEHECNNSIGSFECLCYSGYSLDVNGFNCTGMFV